MARVMSNHAAAAAMVRRWMRENGFVGRVNADSYAGGSSVNIYVQDLPPNRLEELENYAGQFEYGHFDGMIDLYEYSNVREDIPQVRFVFVNNEISAEMRQRIWDFLRGYYNGMENAPENAQDAGLYRNQNFQEYGNVLIYRAFRGGYMQNEFWNFVNGVVEQEAA